MSSILSEVNSSDQASLQALADSIPYAQFIGLKIILIGDELTCLLPFKEDNVGNPMLPALHGGVVSALLEFSAIMQLIGDTKPEHFPKPVNVNVEYLRSAKPLDTFARAIVTKHGRRVANVRAEAWQTDRNRPIAALHGHFLLAQRETTDG